MRRTCISLLLLAASISALGQCESGEIAIQADRDNTLYEHPTGELSNGVGNHFFAGVTAQAELRRALLRFDIADALPAGSTIDAARLILNLSQTRNIKEDVALHRTLADWGEGSSDAPGMEGTGDQATEGDATWLHRFYDSESWSEAGGDFEPTESASIAVLEELGPYTWGSTDAMVGDVQVWLDEPASNYGWMVLGNEFTSPSAKRFDSRHIANQSLRPLLCVRATITPLIEIPTLGTLGMTLSVFLLAVVAIARLRNLERSSR